MTDVRNFRFAHCALAVITSLSLVGCFGSSTAYIGTWSLAPQGGDGCPETMQFTSTTMSATAAGITSSHDVTFASNGGNVTASSTDGFTTTMSVNGNNLSVLQPVQCTYVRS
jgi:hypothetical protein